MELKHYKRISAKYSVDIVADGVVDSTFTFETNSLDKAEAKLIADLASHAHTATEKKAVAAIISDVIGAPAKRKPGRPKGSTWASRSVHLNEEEKYFAALAAAAKPGRGRRKGSKNKAGHKAGRPPLAKFSALPNDYFTPAAKARLAAAAKRAKKKK